MVYTCGYKLVREGSVDVKRDLQLEETEKLTNRDTVCTGKNHGIFTIDKLTWTHTPICMGHLFSL